MVYLLLSSFEKKVSDPTFYINNIPKNIYKFIVNHEFCYHCEHVNIVVLNPITLLTMLPVNFIPQWSEFTLFIKNC